MKIKLCLLALVLFSTQIIIAQDKVPVYKNLELSFEERANDLVSRMSLKEKVSQLVHDAAAIERLDVPAYNWMNECLHGVANMEGFATVFPQPIGMGASFNPELLHLVASAISDEARAMHHNGVKNAEEGYVCGLTFWTPDINLFRDPRWGRGQETYGEDPYLMGRMAVSFIKGLQGDHSKYLKTVSTVKHYVVHSGPEDQRHEFNTISNERDFWETYMPHYITAIQDANVQSVMCAYSRLNGESCCGSDYLLNKLLRDQLGFDGYVVSDCGSVSDIYDGHHLTESFKEAAVLALKSGVDLNCGRAMTFPYDSLDDAVKEGLIDISYIDKSVYRLMLARFKLGMFDPPDQVLYAKMGTDVIDSQANKLVALQMARESMVLLKNANHTLPFKKDIQKIAVIGPNAEDHDVLFGNYHGTPSHPVSVLEGIREKLSGAEILYSRGSELIDSEDFFLPVPDRYLFTPDKEKGIRASYFANKDFSGRPLHTRIEQIVMLFDEFGPPFDDLEINNFSIRYDGYISFPESSVYQLQLGASPRFKMYVDDKLVSQENQKAEPMHFEGGKLYKLRIDFISDEDGFYVILGHAADNASLKKNALNIAEKADAVVLALGISSLIEEEGLDRERIELPDIQQTLIKEVLKLGKPTVLVLLNGSAIALEADVLKVPAILEAWYPGQSGGTAIADVLFGDYNPAGRLPLTFYQSTKDLPAFRNYHMEGRTYKFFRGKPLYAFGYGLSYSNFAYSNLKMPESIDSGDDFTVSVNVKNTGNVDGDEVVQLYIKDINASVRVPIQSLQGFERVHLKTGEQKAVTFRLTPKNLALLSDDMVWMVEPGEFMISVGGGLPGYVPETSGILSKTLHVKGRPHIVKN